MIGPGIYDDLCTQAREAADARAVLLLVIGGAKGNGFSLQGPPMLIAALPHMLRTMADQIEADACPPGAETPSFVCPRCRARSFNPKDIREGYCGACHDWTARPGS